VYGDRYYLELERTRRDGEDVYFGGAIALATELDLAVVATNDVCFIERDDFEAHETRVCIQEGRTLNDPRRVRRYSGGCTSKPEEMEALFADVPESARERVEIANAAP
jgi:DNA polymerase-3 subunit alpha